MVAALAFGPDDDGASHVRQISAARDAARALIKAVPFGSPNLREPEITGYTVNRAA